MKHPLGGIKGLVRIPEVHQLVPVHLIHERERYAVQLGEVVDLCDAKRSHDSVGVIGRDSGVFEQKPD